MGTDRLLSRCPAVENTAWLYLQVIRTTALDSLRHWVGANVQQLTVIMLEDTIQHAKDQGAPSDE